MAASSWACDGVLRVLSGALFAMLMACAATAPAPVAGPSAHTLAQEPSCLLETDVSL